MNEYEAAVSTPKDQRTQRQKDIIFGDCNPDLKYEVFVERKEELFRRLKAGEYLTSTDRREALRWGKLRK